MLVNLRFFLKNTKAETDGIKELPGDTATISLIKNSLKMEFMGDTFTVTPMEYFTNNSLGNGIQTIDFFSKNLLRTTTI